MVACIIIAQDIYVKHRKLIGEYKVYVDIKSCLPILEISGYHCKNDRIDITEIKIFCLKTHKCWILDLDM